MFDYNDEFPEEAFHQLLDVPFVPTDEKVVDIILELADLGPKDVLFDLGSGDGRIVVKAAKENDIYAVGIELDPLRNEEAYDLARWTGVLDQVSFREEDLLKTDLSSATVISMYLLHTVNLELRPKLLKLKPGTRIISHAFDMGDWRPDKRIRKGGVSIYKWLVPAQIAGIWEWRCKEGNHWVVSLTQEYQRVTGSAEVNQQTAYLTGVKVRGERVDIFISRTMDDEPICFPMRYENNQLVARELSLQATPATLIKI